MKCIFEEKQKRFHLHIQSLKTWLPESSAYMRAAQRKREGSVRIAKEPCSQKRHDSGERTAEPNIHSNPQTWDRSLFAPSVSPRSTVPHA